MPVLSPPPPGLRWQAFLGSGPAGHVHVARDERSGRTVVVKLLDPRRCTPAGLVRLAACAARAATSPIAREGLRYEVVTDTLRPHIVMDLLPGESLQRVLLRTGPIPWKRACAVAHAVAVALEAAHDVGVVHGAVKPTNVFLDDSFVHLTDFGIRSLPDPLNADVLLDDAGRLAPEQLRGERPDERTDVYALGLLLYELVTGRLPFEGPPRQVFRQQLSQHPPAPSSFAPSLPPAADRLILALLDKQRRRRPSSASQLRGLLSAPENLSGEPLLQAERMPCCAPPEPEPWSSSVSPREASSPTADSPARPALPRHHESARRLRYLAAAGLVTALAGSLAATCL